MRRSEWRRRADDPKGLLGWWWRGFSSAGWPFALVLGPMLGFALFSGSVVRATGTVVLAVAAGTLRLARARDDLAPLLPDPAPEEQFRAAVRYHRGPLVTGRDEMALVVVDGWLHAEGARSYFALRPEDAVRLGTRPDHQAWVELSDGSVIHFEGLGAPARAALERWHDPDRWMDGEPVFPPADPSLEECARWGARGVAGTFLIFVPNIVAAYLHWGSRFADLRFAGALIAFGIACWSRSRLGRLAEIAREIARQKALAGQAPPLQRDVECDDSSPLGSGDLSARVSPTVESKAKPRRRIG